MRAVHQLAPVLTLGDAISSATITTREMLRELGFDSEIYAEVLDPRLGDVGHHLDQFPVALTPDDIVLYHLSLGSRVAATWAASSARKVIVYHNITPPQYFQSISARVTFDLQRGRDQLHELATLADFCIADSHFNLDELLAAGATRGAVVAPPVDVSRLQPVPAHPSPPPTLLFVGRLAPNKRQDHLIRVLYALQQTTHPDARLVLAGGSDDTEDYVTALRQDAKRLGIADAVDIPTHRLSDDDLRDYYLNASVFVCASEHEGFCVPLLEAMSFEIPIIAYAAGAVAETLGSGGILLHSLDPLVWSETVGRALDDGGLRRSLVSAGQERVRAFSPDRLRGQLSDALRQMGALQ